MNETEHTIELPGTNQRLAGKTGWEPDHIRGDFADTIVFDEFQLMHEAIWTEVGAPMMLDTDGTAVFGFTPRSLHNRQVSRAEDPQFATNLYRHYDALMKKGNPRYYAQSFTSHDNPYLSKAALEEITSDMTALSYQLEIMAQDMNEVPGALWTRKNIEDNRVHELPKAPFQKIAIGVDPPGALITEAGIIACGRVGRDIYVLNDLSMRGSPEEWAQVVVKLFRLLKANIVVAEVNYGGLMVQSVLRAGAPSLPIKMVSASRGKMLRAEPVAAISEQGRLHMVGNFPRLENEMTMYLPGDPSPNRLDALVWAVTELMAGGVIQVHSR